MSVVKLGLPPSKMVRGEGGGMGGGQLKSLEKDLPGLKYFDFWKGITKLGRITLVVTKFL